MPNLTAAEIHKTESLRQRNAADVLTEPGSPQSDGLSLGARGPAPEPSVYIYACMHMCGVHV